MSKKYKVIDYKKERDKALEAMVKFRKLGDIKMANAYLNLAAHIEAIRTNSTIMSIIKTLTKKGE